MDQIRMKYWEMDVWKVNEFNVLNEEVEECTSSWIQNLVNVSTLATWSKRFLNIV